MAVGILFVFLTPGYVPELNTFLFGNILTITASDLWLFAGFTALLLAFFLAFRHTIIACAFDRDFAKVAGLPVKFINYAMTVFVAVSVVLTIRLIGIMLLLAMLTVPILIAEVWCKRFMSIMLVAMGVSLASSLAGLLLATVIDVPCSAIIVLLQIAVYAVARLCADIITRHLVQ